MWFDVTGDLLSSRSRVEPARRLGKVSQKEHLEALAQEPAVLRDEAETPASEPETPASEPETPASEAETPASEPETPASEPETPASEPETLESTLDAEEEPEPAPALDPERAARRAAALSLVRRFGDPALKSRARDVEHFDETLRAEIERMGAIMKDAMGIGLAATQLGTMHRLLVYRVEPDATIAALVNPRLEWAGDERVAADEGCLSLPGVLVEVERPLHVRVSAHDGAGDPVLIEATGLEARVIQHELDHLDGVLILDRTSRQNRKEAIRGLREREREMADEVAA